jgi:hypothetical protein
MKIELTIIGIAIVITSIYGRVGRHDQDKEDPDDGKDTKSEFRRFGRCPLEDNDTKGIDSDSQGPSMCLSWEPTVDGSITHARAFPTSPICLRAPERSHHHQKPAYDSKWAAKNLAWYRRYLHQLSDDKVQTRS